MTDNSITTEKSTFASSRAQWLHQSKTPRRPFFSSTVTKTNQSQLLSVHFLNNFSKTARKSLHCFFQSSSMAASVQEDHEPQELPLILVHRLPSVKLSLKARLQTQFRLLDPSDSSEPTHSFLSTHAQSVRVLLCVALTPLAADTIRSLPSLECVVASSAGVNHIDLEECRRRGIAVTNAGSAFSENVADYSVGMLIDVLRKISVADRHVRAGLWPVKGDYSLGSKLGGKRVGILGLGSIGSEIAKRLVAFGCSIAYTSRSKKPSVSFPYYPNVSDLAANSDALIICCALTNETHHIINKDVMTALGQKGVIINVGRGSLIDEKELVQFLVQGEIGGAGLDVFENEAGRDVFQNELNAPKELFELDNVVLSPHGSFITPESIAALNEVIMANLEAFFSNKPLVSPVNV